MPSGSSPIKLNLIAAACDTMGIGNKGDLPWRLKSEMAYFTSMTTKSDVIGKQNAVLMGTKTWLSIPPKYRPLAGRINIVISRKLQTTPEGAGYLCNSLDNAVGLLSSEPLVSQVDKVWIVGGSELYKEAMESKYCHRIYLTRVMAHFECDTFFPNISLDRFKLVQDEAVTDEIQEENGLKYKFEVYEKFLQEGHQ